MGHRLVSLFLVTVFIVSLGWLGSIRAQTASPELQLQTQTISGATFVGSQDGSEPPQSGVAADSPVTTETPPTAAPAPFNYLMLRWRATATEETQVALEIRASEDGQSWSEWGEVHHNEDLVDPNDPAGVYWSHTIYAGLSRLWQMRVTLTPGADGSLPVLHEVRVNTIDSRGPDPAAITAPEPGGAQIAGAVAMPSYISRDAWGGDTVRRGTTAVPPAYRTATHLVLHHTADSNSLRAGETTWADRVRAEWAFHTYPSGRGWGDVGYNWLVSPNGVIYEGRYSSADPSRDPVAFHDTGNYGSMGVVMLGTFQSTIGGAITPTAAAQDGVVKLFAWKASQRGIDPLGSSFYYGCSISNYCKPFNAGSIVRNIAGHQQVTPGHTSCPGDLSMGVLDSIRRRVRDMIANTTPPTPVPPTATSRPTATPRPTTAPQPTARAEIVNVEFKGWPDANGPVVAGGVLQARFTIKNTGSVAIGTQQPPPGKVEDPGAGHVYGEDECFLGNGSRSYQAFPEVKGSLRVVLAGYEGGNLLGTNCVAGADGYPWRWGVDTTLQPGQTRTVVGYVRFRNTGGSARGITLRAGLVNEQVGYYSRDAWTGAINVLPEDKAPAVSSSDENGLPLASVYRLARGPISLLYNSPDPASAREDTFVGTFAWDGTEQRWGDGGPLGERDFFVIEQVRPFMAPVSGTYAFETSTDDASWLWVDGQLVVSNHGLHAPRAVSGSRWLAAGVHTVTIKYLDAFGAASARYSWQPPSTAGWSTIPILRSAGAPRRDNAYGAGAQVALAADDVGGLGVEKIQLFVNGSEVPEERPGSVAILSLSEGEHWVWYRTVDRNNNWSSNFLTLVRVDTTPPVTALSTVLQANGAIELQWTSSPDAMLFQLQVSDQATGTWADMGTANGNRSAFIGKPGHAYQFRIRGWDGINWESYGQPTSPQTVPTDARFWHVQLPTIRR